MRNGRLTVSLMRTHWFLTTDSPPDLELLQEVVCLSIYGKRTLGLMPLQIQRGNLDSNHEEVEVEEPARIIVGNSALQKALVAGEISALVVSANGVDLFKVPLSYWVSRTPWGHEKLDLDFEEEDDGIDLVGQPILVDAAQVRSWQNVVERALKQSKAGATGKMRPLSIAEADRWYLARVENWDALKPPTREEDVAAGREVGLTAIRVRDLRRNHAPAHWTKKGRRAAD